MTSATARLQLLQELGKSHVTDQERLHVAIDLRRPFNINYEIRSFIEDEDVIDEKVFGLMMKELRGIEGYFEYRMSGKIVQPRALEGLSSTFEVKPLLPSGCYEYGLNGHIGRGWFWGEHDQLFRIYVPPQMAKDLLFYSKLKDQMAQSDVDEEHAWMRIRIEISNYRESHDGEKVLFDIDSVSN